jgi:curli production assembly/transport component CsgG
MRLATVSVVLLTGCSQIPLSPPSVVPPAAARADAVLTPGNRITRELVRLPDPRYRIPVGVYAFRDMTGQFKPQPDSNLSNAVTQGAAALLVKALLDSNWFIPIEREGLQNLLTERRIARAIELPGDQNRAPVNYPQLLPAWFIIEGGITGYEQNVRTGGEGANLLGIGADIKYQIDQVTVNLRSVDVRSGQVINSVLVTKTIYSHSFNGSIYRYVAYKQLLQAEGGFSTNEPSQLAVKEAIESAVIHLIVQGARDKAWFMRNDSDWEHPTVQAYLREADGVLLGSGNEKQPIQVPRPGNVMVLPTPQPQSAVRPVSAAPSAPVRPTAPVATLPTDAPTPTPKPAPTLSTTTTTYTPSEAAKDTAKTNGDKKTAGSSKSVVPAKAVTRTRAETEDKPLAPASIPPRLPNRLEPLETPPLPALPPASEEDDKLMSNPMPLNLSKASGSVGSQSGKSSR